MIQFLKYTFSYFIYFSYVFKNIIIIAHLNNIRLFLFFKISFVEKVCLCIFSKFIIIIIINVINLLNCLINKLVIFMNKSCNHMFREDG